jgi:rod shape-determining protein MreB
MLGGFMFSRKLGIDLGTVNVTIAEREQILLHETAVVAITVEDERIVAIGQEAREMYGRTPESIEVMRPMRDGVIADYEVTEAMLRYFVDKVIGGVRLFKPTVMITVPYGVTSVERRAVHEAAIQAGARDARLIPEPLAASLGAGLPIDTPTGNMIVNLGGGTSEAAVVAMNGIVAAASERVGGVRIDEAIANYVRKKYNLVIGEVTAELAKINIGAAIDIGEELRMDIQGRDQVDGLPKMITLSTSEIIEAIDEPLAMIAGVVKRVLERTPPELSSDIIDRGMVLTGGTSLLRGIDQYLTRETNVPAFLADDPVGATALGASRGLERIDVLQRSVPDL